MKVIEYFTSPDKEHWRNQIAASDWPAGVYLAELLRKNELKALVGETALVLLLTEGRTLISFCTLAPLDEVQPTALGPWIGFVYTFPAYRGQRMAGVLLEHAECLAAVMGRETVYISTDHVGLYETYGFQFYEAAKDIHGEDTRIYRMQLPTDGPEREPMLAKGGALKATIVAGARQSIDPVAVCGFSCNHCFLGEWCGGCRSCFNCCSYGTLFEKGKCPNIACAQEKGLEGCYACEQLEHCRTGFYTEGNDGAHACKAQALLIRRHGKQMMLRVQDRLHEQYDFKKIQEILGQDLTVGCRILEETAAALTACAEPEEGTEHD